MKHTTVIDTVGIQINCNAHNIQVETVKGLLSFIDDIESLHIHYKDYPRNIATTMTTRVYFINHKRRTVAKISTNTYTNKNTMYQTVYYIKVKFAGLQSYSDISDKASKEFLYGMCDYLNRRKIEFKLTELDIAIDIPCDFKQMMVICTKKAPRTLYYEHFKAQAYARTFYVERLNKVQFKRATRRAYIYDKGYKEKLGKPLSRFELKLQSLFFRNKTDLLKAIEKTLDKYHVLYFKNRDKAKTILRGYYTSRGTARERIKKSGLGRYRLEPDIKVIEDFLKQIHPSLHQPLKRL